VQTPILQQNLPNICLKAGQAYTKNTVEKKAAPEGAAIIK
jgi:hypothetical protein